MFPSSEVSGIPFLLHQLGDAVSSHRETSWWVNLSSVVLLWRWMFFMVHDMHSNSTLLVTPLICAGTIQNITFFDIIEMVSPRQTRHVLVDFTKVGLGRE